MEKTIVATIKNFCALLLLRNASPPHPNTGESPVPGACNIIAATRSIEITICIIEIIITPIIYVLISEMQVFVRHDKVGILYLLSRPR